MCSLVGAVLVIFCGWSSSQILSCWGGAVSPCPLTVEEDFDDVFTDWSCINFSAMKRAFVIKTFSFEGEL